MFPPKTLKTEKDVDEVAEYLKGALKEAQEAGQEGIEVVHQFAPDTHRSELRFTFEQEGITFSGCLYEPEIIGTVLRHILVEARQD